MSALGYQTKVRIDPARMRALSVRSAVIPLAHLLVEWLAVLAAIALCKHFWHWWLYLLTVAFIGGRQHALITLAHEGIHRRILPNRKWNDLVSELIVLPLVLVNFRKLRDSHLQHHKHANTDRDPDWLQKQDDTWRFPKSLGAVLRILVLDICGFGFVRVIVRGHALAVPGAAPVADQKTYRRYTAVARVVFVAVVVASGFGLDFLLYWVVPFLTWLQFAIRMRSIAEHFAISGRSGVYAEHRTTVTSWLGRTFLVQKNLNYHLEHHLYPAVPFFRLRQLHTELMQDPQYAASAHVSYGYWQVVRECAGAGASTAVDADTSHQEARSAHQSSHG